MAVAAPAVESLRFPIFLSTSNVDRRGYRSDALLIPNPSAHSPSKACAREFSQGCELNYVWHAIRL